jgi:hypothetical protein
MSNFYSDAKQDEFVAVLIEAIKELNQKVDRLTNNQV